MASYIEVNNVSKVFKKNVGVLRRSKTSVTALNRLTLAIDKGELFCLLGPNGAGKTTLIKILCSLILPDSGTVIIDGHDVSQSACLRSMIGFVSANERSFYWRITGRQNLQFFGALYNLFGSQLRQRINEFADVLNIEKELDRRFDTYSSGVKQRLNIARALLHRPPVLFFDDPTRDTDCPTKQKLLQCITEVLHKQEGRTVVFVSHQADEVECVARFGARLCILHQGRIQAQGTLDDLKLKTGSASVEEIFNHYTPLDGRHE